MSDEPAKQRLQIQVTQAGKLARVTVPLSIWENGKLCNLSHLNHMIDIYWEEEIDHLHYKVLIDGVELDFQMWSALKLIQGADDGRSLT